MVPKIWKSVIAVTGYEEFRTDENLSDSYSGCLVLLMK